MKPKTPESACLHFAFGVIVLTLLVFAPVFRCTSCTATQQLIGYTRLPGISREDAAKMIAWADSSPCGRCDNLGRISMWTALSQRSACDTGCLITW
jgi:hypothetical protein